MRIRRRRKIKRIRIGRLDDPSSPFTSRSNGPLSESEAAAEWIRQFEIDDQAIALSLLDRFTLVTRDEFEHRIASRLEELVANGRVQSPVGLYAEREIPRSYGHPNRLFKQRARPPRSAWGAGPQPVRPINASTPSVGSEGIVAAVITQLHRKNAQFLSHPGPNAIRARSVRTLLVVTDFIGSGNRVVNYLDSMWRTASVKSWRSFGLVRIVVVAYETTSRGKSYIESHTCGPLVESVVACPTISELPPRLSEQAAAICKKYNPSKSSKYRGLLFDQEEGEHLGYGGVGALIAFAHGCPNDVPPIFHSNGGRRRWQPLFPGRVTEKSYVHFGDRRDDGTTILRLRHLGLADEAASRLVERAAPSGRSMLLFLVALKSGARRGQAIARRTSLTIPEVRSLHQQAVDNGWATANGHLTDSGRSQIKDVPSIERARETLLAPLALSYYPRTLRAPSKV